LLENNGASFVTGDYITIPSVLTTNAGDSFTFSALIEPINNVGNDYVFTFHDADGNGISAYLAGATGNLSFFADTGGGGKIVTVSNMGSGLYHLTCVISYNGATYDYYVYKNGELIGSTLAQGGYTPSAGDVGFFLGCDRANSSTWAGNIHFPIFMRQALTPTQIKWLSDRAFRELNI